MRSSRRTEVVSQTLTGKGTKVVPISVSIKKSLVIPSEVEEPAVPATISTQHVVLSEALMQSKDPYPTLRPQASSRPNRTLSVVPHCHSLKARDL
jgi:hypothetical protein